MTAAGPENNAARRSILIHWCRRMCSLRPPQPVRVGYDAIVDGFVDPLRTYELPGRMSLPNIVDVLTDIWEIEGVS